MAPWSSNPLAKHFDIIQATRVAIAATPITWTWEHFWGYQDDTQQLLTTTEQHNVEMDIAARPTGTNRSNNHIDKGHSSGSMGNLREYSWEERK